MTYRVRTDAHDLAIVIRKRTCTAMSGRRYLRTVTILLDDERFDGCGGEVAAASAAPG